MSDSNQEIAEIDTSLQKELAQCNNVDVGYGILCDIHEFMVEISTLMESIEKNLEVDTVKRLCELCRDVRMAIWSSRAPDSLTNLLQKIFEDTANQIDAINPELAEYTENMRRKVEVMPRKKAE